MARICNNTETSSTDEDLDIRHQTERAKLYLQTFCPEAGDNFYDHLSEVLTKILMERPQNVFAAFEEYSKKLKNDKFPAVSNSLCDSYKPPSAAKNAKILIKLFKENLSKNEDQHSTQEDAESFIAPKVEIPNMFELLHLFEPADIGLPRAEIVFLNLSIRKLITEENIQDVRFWGKFLGRRKNYYIVEASLSKDELERRLEELKEKEKTLKEETVPKHTYVDDIEQEASELSMSTKLLDNEGIEIKNESFKFVFPPLPKNTWKPPPECTQEQIGTGANEKVYYVCNSPGVDKWVELPSVTPQQIVVARQIVHLCTGDLDDKIHTFPPFPGSEKNYLRAQIARIGAATHVSPIGYFKFGKNTEEEDRDEAEEEEEEDDDDDYDEEEQEEEGEKGTATGKIVKNPHYNPLPLVDLVDPSMSNWCHHSPYILKQGRVIWQDPRKVNNEVEENESEEEEEEDQDECECEEGSSEVGSRYSEKDSAFVKEMGPPLLRPLSQDLVTKFTTPWTARLSSKIQPDTAVALIRSNIWPGAFAVAVDKKFVNLYIGWGNKHNTYNYSPPPMPEIQEQYVIDSEHVEMQDPTVEEENAYRMAHLPPTPESEQEQEGEEEEEEEEEDEEDEEGNDVEPAEVDSVQNNKEDGC